MGFLELAHEAYRKNQWESEFKTKDTNTEFQRPVQSETNAGESIPFDQKVRAAGSDPFKK